MKSIKIDNSKTGWTEIPGATKLVVAHFKDGHKETIELMQFLTLGKRAKDSINLIDCYAEGEKIPE